MKNSTEGMKLSTKIGQEICGAAGVGVLIGIEEGKRRGRSCGCVRIFLALLVRCGRVCSQLHDL